MVDHGEIHILYPSARAKIVLIRAKCTRSLMTKNKCLRILNNNDETDDSPCYGQVSIEKKNHYS